MDGDLLVRDAPVCLSLYALDAEDDEPRDVERWTCLSRDDLDALLAEEGLRLGSVLRGDGPGGVETVALRWED